MERELKITGEGRLSIEPDIAEITLPVTGESNNYEEALNLLNEKVFLVHQILEKNSIEKSKLKTTNFKVDEKWSEYKKNENRVFLGFKASHDLRIELPINNQLISKFLSGLTKSDVGISFSIIFDISDKEIYKNQLIQNAVADAISSAQTIAKAANIKLKEIKNINFSFSEVIFHDENILYEAKMDYSQSIPEFSPQNINAQKNITVIWRIE